MVDGYDSFFNRVDRLWRTVCPRTRRSERLPRSEDSWRLPPQATTDCFFVFFVFFVVKICCGLRPRPGRVSGFVVLVCNVRYAHTHGFTPVARLSVIPFASRTPLPPSTSLRSLRLKLLQRTASATRKRFRLHHRFLAGHWTRRRQAAALPA